MALLFKPEGSVYRVSTDSAGYPEFNIPAHTIGGLVSEPRKFMYSWIDSGSILVGHATHSLITEGSQVSGDFRQAIISASKLIDSTVFDSTVSGSVLYASHVSKKSVLVNTTVQSSTLAACEVHNRAVLLHTTAQSCHFNHSRAESVDAIMTKFEDCVVRKTEFRQGSVGSASRVHSSTVLSTSLAKEVLVTECILSKCVLDGPASYARVKLNGLVLGKSAYVNDKHLPVFYHLHTMMQISGIPESGEYIAVYSIRAGRQLMKAYALNSRSERFTHTTLTLALRQRGDLSEEVFKRLDEVHRR